MDPPLSPPRQATGSRQATGLDLFLIGLDHRPPGISTDSARAPETTGNNRHDPGQPDTRRGRLAAEWNGPSPRVNDRYIRRSALPYVQPGDRPPDDHPLNLRRPLEDREGSGRRGSFHRSEPLSRGTISTDSAPASQCSASRYEPPGRTDSQLRRQRKHEHGRRQPERRP